MGRSLKEALLDQYALLQERGLAPSEVPQDEEAPMVVVESAPRGRVSRSRRDAVDRYGEGDDLDVNGQFDRERRRGQRRDHRGEEPRERRRPTGGSRGRGRPREMESEFVVSAGPAGDRGRPSGPRPPLGPRPPRPGMGAPRPGAPAGPGRPVGRTQIMQQRAEQRRRDDEDIAEMRRLLGELSGQEFDDAAMESFSHGLAQETGALPPPRIVVEAIRESQSADPRRIGDAVRAYYRRPRPRPASASPRTPPTVATPA
ncbi:MAG: hypothetical protein JO023_24700 [Chloroflexi bacterium]|nr:hypothetical protein [Chloroflexota bacterium]